MKRTLRPRRNSPSASANGTLPLTNTQSVTLSAGSITSVSLDGTIVPYGTTTDGTDWQYNAVPNQASNVDLTAPPAKVITINGANVALNSGATIDLSGGGDLQAVEWVPGTGGTRDVLSHTTSLIRRAGLRWRRRSIPTPATSMRSCRAMKPRSRPTIQYNAQVTLPSTAAQSQTASNGVGQAAIGAQIGQAVYLSGVPGLPAGTYVLLPAKYATLPGAYRVIQNTGASNVAPDQSFTTPDGTNVVSGYYVDALNGARSATPAQFQVQSAAVWGQYSQYTETSANSYFVTQAQNNGTVVPPLPIDAGRLAIVATGAATATINPLTLGATLNTAAAPGGEAAQVDIAAQDIQITGDGEPLLAGYLHISADSLDALGCRQPVDRRTRTQTTSGITIDAIANSVVVSNDSNDALTGPEIILVTKADSAGTDANAANGLRIDGGSVIAASGSLNSPPAMSRSTAMAHWYGSPTAARLPSPAPACRRRTRRDCSRSAPARC